MANIIGVFSLFVRLLFVLMRYFGLIGKVLVSAHTLPYKPTCYLQTPQLNINHYPDLPY